MRKYIGIVLAGSMMIVGASLAGCGDDNGGTGGTGATGGTGGAGAVANPCQDQGGTGTVTISGDEITQNTIWEAACDYLLTQLTYVVNAELTIEPGTVVKGQTQAALLITTSGRINAEGTAESPIVFTSNNPDASRSPGDWAGVVLLGLAELSWGDEPCGDETDPRVTCTGQIEGISGDEPRAEYGGTDDDHDCGTMKYVRIEFAGFDLQDGDELNSLTLGGCGSDTVLENIQVHRGLDDGVEWFGGTASIKNVIASGMGDDGLDWDRGWRGSIDNAIVHHFASNTSSPNGIEADNNGEGNNNVEPRSNPQVTNVTIIGDGDPLGWGVVTRVGTWGVLDGLVVTGFGAGGYDMRNGAWSLENGWPTNLVVQNSCFWSNNGNDFPADEGCQLDPPTSDCNDPKEATAPGGTADFFAEDTLLVDPARENIQADPGIGDVSTACTGMMPAPDYGLTNGACAGAFGGPGGGDWTAEWTSFPAGSAVIANCP